jgi:SAM-dependent methyltransferase
MIGKVVPPDPTIRIVDLGCGSGAILRVLAERGYRSLLGVDVSQEQATLARNLPGVTVVTADLREFLANTSDGSYEVIIAFDVLEHFTRDELLTILRNIHRVLRQGGRLIAHVPNGEGSFGARSFFWDATHQTGWTRASAGQLTSVAGFTSCTTYEDTPAVHGVVSLVRAVLWRLLRLWWRFALAVETGDMSADVVLSQNMLFCCKRD